MPRQHAQVALARLLGSTPPSNDAPPPLGLYRSTMGRYIYWATNGGYEFNNRAVFMNYYSQITRFNVAWAENRFNSGPAMDAILATLGPRDREFWATRVSPYSFESIYHLINAQFMPHDIILAGEGRMNPRTWASERAQPIYLPHRGRRWRQGLNVSWAPYMWVLTHDTT